MSLTRDDRHLINAALEEAIGRATLVAEQVAALVVYASMPPAIRQFVDSARQLQLRIAPGDTKPKEFDLSGDELKLLRTAIGSARRERAEQVERSQRHLVSIELGQSLDQTLKPFDALLETKALARVIPRAAPGLAQFLSDEGRRDIRPPRVLRAEEHDPKHRILLNSALLLDDLETYRQQCDDRRLPFAVVFADLDDFKQFNTELGEVTVDRFVLPQVLQAVERASFGHGRAYRHGGDEFVLLVPNVNLEMVDLTVGEVKRSVERLRFDVTSLTPKLSAGAWITAPSSHLTANEVVERASKAKKASKEAGKSRITIRIEIGSEYSESLSAT